MNVFCFPFLHAEVYISENEIYAHDFKTIATNKNEFKIKS